MRLPTPIVEIDFTDDPIARHADVVRGYGALSHYRLGDTSGTTATEEIGGLTGTYEGGFTLNQSSIIGDGNGSVLLNGSTGNVVIAHGATYNAIWIGNSGFSISAWVKATALRNGAAANASGIVCYEYAGSHIPFVLAYGREDAATGNRNRVWGGYFVTSTGWHIVSDTNELPLNTWVHFVLTVIGQTTFIYRDGILIASQGQANNWSASAASLNTRIGRRWDTSATGTDEFFPGYIDEVSFYKYALSSLQVATLYASGPARMTKEVNYVDLSSRVRSFNTSRGRQDSVDRVEAGELSLVLDNRDGKLSPEPVINYLFNPSFESGLWTGSKMDPSFWNVTGGTLERVSTQAHSHGSSGKLNSNAVATCYTNPAFDSMGAGLQYTASVYVWVPSGLSINLSHVYLTLFDDDGTGEQVSTSGNPGAFDSWQRLTVTRTMRANGSTNGMRVHLDPQSVANKFIYVDSAQIEPGASASTYGDGDTDGNRWGGFRWTSQTHRQVAGGYPNIIPYRRVRVRADYGADQLLSNGGFEKGVALGTGDANNAAIEESTSGWQLSTSNATAALEFADDVSPRNDWRIKSTPSSGANATNMVSNYILIDATSAYTLAAYFRGTDTNLNFKFACSCYDQHKKFISQVEPNQAASGVNLSSAPEDLNSANTWEKWGGTITSGTWPAGTKFVRVYIQLTNQATSGQSYYVDCVQFVKGSAAISDADYANQGIFPVFEGYIEDWRHYDPHEGHDSVVQIVAADVMTSLSYQQFSQFIRAAESPRDRMRAVLLSAAIPADKIDLGVSTDWVTNNLDEITLGEIDGTSQLEYIRQIEASETGTFWVGAEERYVYKGTAGLRKNQQVYVFVDGSAAPGTNEVPYVEVPTFLSARNVANDRVQNNPATAGSNRDIDPGSIRRYWHRPISYNVVWDSNIWVTVSRAHVLPQTEQLELRPASDPTRLWPIVLQLEFGDKIDVKKSPKGLGRDLLASFSQTVEGIAHEYTPGTWVVTISASSVFGDF